MVVVALPPGQSKEMQHISAAERIVNVCKMAKRVWGENPMMACTKIRFNIGQMCIINVQNDVVSTQLHLYNENKDAFIAAFQGAEYNQKIVDLLKMLH